jgi:hypothetical protein
MEDDFDYDTIQATGEKHKDNFAALVKKLKTRYADMLPMGAGTCTLCESCTFPDGSFMARWQAYPRDVLF